MSIGSRFVWLFLLLICNGHAAGAQDYLMQTGNPAFSVTQPVQNGYVNLANGNLHIEIPLAEAPQRGSLPFAAKMVYDSRIWQIVRIGGSLVWKPTNIPNSISGWRFATTADPGIVAFDSTQVTPSCIQGNFTVNNISFFWTSPDGTRRYFPIVTQQDPGCPDDISSSDAYALDSSGFHMFVTDYTNVTIYAKDGTQVYPTVKDTNGNFFSTDANGNVIDTLGRSLVRKSVSGSTTFYDVLNSQGTTSRITVTTRQIPVRTLFSQPGVSEDTETITVVDNISLPSGDSYGPFGYDAEVIVDPSNGAFHPGYGLLGGVTDGGPYQTVVDSFGVANRWYTATMDGTIQYTPAAGGLVATITRNGGTQAFGFTLNNGAWLTSSNSSVGMQITNTYDFNQRCPGISPSPNIATSWCSGPAYIRLLTSVVSDAGGTKQTIYGYDSPQTGNITSVKNWNYYSGTTAPANPDRQTVITMHPLIGKNIIDRVQSAALEDGLGNVISKTNYDYDTLGLAPVNHTVINNDTSVGSGRGNLTQISRWVGGSSFLDTFLTYDTTGQLVKIKDPAGNLTTFDYSDNFFKDDGTSNPPSANPAVATNAYPTTVTLPIGSLGLGYYFGRGKKAFTVDQNNQRTSQHFLDSLDRLTQVVGPLGWQQVTYGSLFAYDLFTGMTDSVPSIGCTGCSHVSNVTDFQGRVISSTLQSDPDGAVTNTISYDPAGNVLTASNPSRGSGAPGTTNNYDVLYRLTKTTNPDNSIARIFYGNVTQADPGATANQFCAAGTYGRGMPILLINEDGKKHQAWQDAFGHVIEIDEPDANNALTVATCYQYSLHDQLTKVVQGDLIRTYQYDPLGRVTQVTTPEGGTETYNYVNDDGTMCSGGPSNVCKRVDSRGIATRYQYDSLNRLTKKTYSDGTPTAVFNYQETSAFGVTLANTAGRPSSVYTQDGTGKILTGEVFSYDAEGNVIDNSQCTPQNCGTSLFHNTYAPDRAGNMVGLNTSWGRNISSNLNTAGQVTSLTVSPSDSTHPATILANAKYNGFGQLVLATLGNGLTQASGFSDTRGFLNALRITGGSGNQASANAATQGSATISVAGSVGQLTGGSAPGSATLTLSGSLRQATGNLPASSSTGSLTINGVEQEKATIESPATPGAGAVTISGNAQSKVVTVAAVPGTGAFIIGGSSLEFKPAVNPTPGTGSITISGTEQSKSGVGAHPGTPGTGSVAFSGFAQCASDGSGLCDIGTVTITVNGFSDTTFYSGGSPCCPNFIASQLVAQSQADHNPYVTVSPNGSSVLLTAKTSGANTNYSLSASTAWDNTDNCTDANGNPLTPCFPQSSFTPMPSGPALTGGTDAYPGITVYDHGSCTVTVNGTQYSKSFNQGDTTSTIASGLASSISAGSTASATASGGTITVTAKSTGTATNYSLSSSCTFDSADFTSASFAASASGASLTGGGNGSPAATDSGTVTLTVGGSFNASACFGASGHCAVVDASCGTGDSTAAEVACVLASPNNANGLRRAGSPVTVSGVTGSTINLATPDGSNPGFSSSTVFDSADFSSPSFAGNNSSITGGVPSFPKTLFDSGTVSVTAGPYTTAMPYGQFWLKEGPLPANILGSNGHLFALSLSTTFTSEHLFYSQDGDSGDMFELSTDANGTWSNRDLTALFGVRGNPMTGFSWPGSTEPEHLFVSSFDVLELYSDTSGNWHSRDLTTLTNSPSVNSFGITSFLSTDPNAPEHVFYQDQLHHLHELWRDLPGNWHEQDLTNLTQAPNVGAFALTSFAWPNSAAPKHVFFATGPSTTTAGQIPTGDIHELWSDTSGTWHDRNITALSGAPAGGAPTTSFLWPNSNAPEHVFYGTTDSHIHEIWSDSAGNWHHRDVTTNSGAPTVAGGISGSGLTVQPFLSSFLSSDPNAPGHLFFTDPNTHAWELSSDINGNWHPQDLTAATGMIPTAVGAALMDANGEHTFATNRGPISHLHLGVTTAGQLASSLANDPNLGLNIPDSPVSVTLSGGILHLTSKEAGANSNLPLLTSVTFDSNDFAAPSFTASSASSLTGGKDAVFTPLYDSGAVSVSINGFSNIVEWGEGATGQSIASALATRINQNAGNVADPFTLSSNWTIQEGKFQFNSGGLIGSTGGTDSRAVAYWTGSFGADQFAQLSLAALPANTDGLGPAVRVGSSGLNYYAFYVTVLNPHFYLFKVVNGTLTVLAQGTRTSSVGDVLRLEVAGTTLTGKINGAVIATATDSSLQAGNPGIQGCVCNGGTTVVSNWSGGSSTPAVNVADAFGLNPQWITQEGKFQINGNSVSAVSGGSTDGRALAYWSGLFDIDQFAQLAVTSMPQGNAVIGPAVRVGASGINYYAFYVDNTVANGGTGNFYLFKVVNGTLTVLAFGPKSINLNDVLRLDAIGTTLTARINGIVIASATDADLQNGNPGIQSSVFGNPSADSATSWLAGSFTDGGGAPVMATVSGANVTLTSKTTGSATNYPLAANVSFNAADFAQASFTVQTSGSALQGGNDANGTVTDTGALTITVNGFTKAIPYGPSVALTPAVIANAFNNDPASPVWASGSNNIVGFTSKKTGASTNYPISAVSATNSPFFTGTSFPVSLTGSTLTGGTDSGSQTTISDSGIINLSIGSFSTSVEYGRPGQGGLPFTATTACCTASAIATAIGTAINQSNSSPVIAGVSGSQIKLVAKTGGIASNYSFSAASQSFNPSQFPTPSFSFTAPSGALSGGADPPNTATATSAIAAISFSGGGTWNPPSNCAANYQLVVGGETYTTCLNDSPIDPVKVASLVAQSVNDGNSLPIKATASGTAVYLQSTSAGASTNYIVNSYIVNGACCGSVPLTAATSGSTMSGGAGNSTNNAVYALDIETDATGTVFSANDSVNGNWSYLYDNLNRLQQASTPTTGYTYDYDMYGNRLHQTPLNGGNALSLLYVNNQIRAPGVSYDLSGNMIADGNHTYAYDAENRLISVDSGQTAAYTYSADGRRIRTTIASTSTDFVYDLNGEVMGVLRSDGTLVRQEIGGLATYADVAYFHHRDWLGNLRVITDYAGTIRQTCTNLPYGDALTCVNPGITPTNFAAYTRDNETGLDFARARYYSSQYGRFMSMDPIGSEVADPQSLNPYGYVGNRVLSATDPSGMSEDDCSNGPCTPTIIFVSPRSSSSSTNFGGWSVGSFVFSGGPIGGSFGGPPTFISPNDLELMSVLNWNSDAPSGPPPPSQAQIQASKAVGAPGFWESLIPVWGSARAAINDFQTGHWGWGLFNSALAISDVFLVKSAITVIGKVAVAGVAKLAAKEVGLEVFEHASTHGIQPYNLLRKSIAGTGLEAHHLIEKRFASVLAQNARKMASIALTPGEHRIFTNAWRAAIPYGAGTARATAAEVLEAARQIYADNDVILRALGLK
jgi:RHS repeat-associated protein